jgi:hypothetical protein
MLAASVLPLLAAAAVAVAWSLLGFPSSLAEVQFARALKSERVRGAPDLKLPELMRGDWELVCGSNGYGGEFYVKRYNRTYPAVGALHDGSWGLVFIAKDGSYVSAAGNCTSPGVYLSVEGCLERAKATLAASKVVSQTCPQFGPNDG